MTGELSESSASSQTTYNNIENNILNRKLNYFDVVYNEFKTPFLLIKVEYDETGKKKYKDGLKKEYTKKTFEECKIIAEKNIKNNFEYNQILFKVPNNYLIIDTDSEVGYTELKQLLKDNNLYYSSTITKSFNGREKNIKYKRHFIFKIEDKKQYKKHSGRKGYGKIADIFYNSWGVAEFTISKIEIDNIPVLNYDVFNSIQTLFNKLNDKENNNNNNNNNNDDNEDNENNNDDDNENNNDDDIYKEYLKTSKSENLITILTHLKVSRFDNFDDWIIIYQVFLNEDFNLEIFNEYSKRSKNYNEQNNNKIMNNYKPREDGYKIGTLYKMLKEDNYNIFIELTKNLKINIFDMALNMTQNIIADFYYQLEPNKYIISENTGWYEYNKNNILIPKGTKAPPSLLNHLSKTLQDVFFNARNKLRPPPPGAPAEEWEEFKRGQKIYNNAIKIMGGSKFSKGCIDFLIHLYTDVDLDKKLDANNNIIAFEDKLYDITLNEYRDITPQDYITKTCKRKAPTGEHLEKQERIKNILFSIFENNEVVNYWLKIIGLSLFTNKYENFFTLLGRGGNGKGLMFELLKNCIGDYFYPAENTFLTAATKAGAANSTLAKCKGVRVLSVSEPNNGGDTCNLNTDFIKSMTGRDDITTRELYQSNITYIPVFNVFLQCNDMPNIKKLDNGITRRLRIINYPLQFVENPINASDRQVDTKLKDEFKNDEELKDAFTQLLFKYAFENIKFDTIEAPNEVKLCLDEIIEDNNPVKSFINEFYIITNDEKNKIKQNDLYEHYCSHTKNKLDNKQFCAAMRFNDFIMIKSHGIKYWQRLQKKNEEELDND